jgi:hypothetical protein
MTSILDIDLDYFRFFNDPLDRLAELLDWANRPVDKVVDHHHKSFEYWKRALAKRSLPSPQFILHVDEHHDMLSETEPIQFGNFLYFAMQRWPECRVHWQVNGPIDFPSMWLSDESWDSVASRFTMGPRRRCGWPKPDIVTVCTSPGFIDKRLAAKLLGAVRQSSLRRAGNGWAVSSKVLFCPCRKRK